MSFHILIERSIFTEKSSSGKMYWNGNYFGHTLEDPTRGENVKIPGVTCLPTGTYRIKNTYSTRFKKLMPIIYNQENGYQVINKGISFKGARIHGGNRAKDTLGCPLVAKHRQDDDTIYGSLGGAITRRIGDREGWITIINQ